MSLTNTEIRNLYIKNIDNPSSDWMVFLFSELDFLVINRTKNFKNFLEKEDLEQELKMAIWEAIITFDWQKNFDFYRWSHWHLTKAKRDFIKKMSSHISINLRVVNTKYSYKILDDKVLLDQIMKLEIITNQEANILWSYYVEGHTLKELSQIFCLSQERIRQIKKLTLKKIKRKISLGNTYEN